MSTRYEVALLCPNGHRTTTELLRVTVDANGYADGLAGSDADFCAVCNARPRVLGINEITEDRCADCGEYGVLTGHMECQYPRDHEEQS